MSNYRYLWARYRDSPVAHRIQDERYTLCGLDYVSRVLPDDAWALFYVYPTGLRECRFCHEEDTKQEKGL